MDEKLPVRQSWAEPNKNGPGGQRAVPESAVAAGDHKYQCQKESICIMSILDLFFSRTPAVSVTDAHRIVGNGDAILIDVRESDEFKSGHAPKAINTPLSSLKDQLKRIPKDKPILVICLSGHRSHQASAFLKKAGIEDIREVKGGMMAWGAAKLPVQR